MTKDTFNRMKILRDVSPEECNEVADFVEAETKSLGETRPEDPQVKLRLGQRVNRKVLVEWGDFQAQLGRPSKAMSALARSVELEDKLAAALPGLQKIQNELTVDAMILVTDIAATPAPDEVSEGDPDLSGLT